MNSHPWGSSWKCCRACWPWQRVGWRCLCPWVALGSAAPQQSVVQCPCPWGQPVCARLLPVQSCRRAACGEWAGPWKPSRLLGIVSSVCFRLFIGAEQFYCTDFSFSILFHQMKRTFWGIHSFWMEDFCFSFWFHVVFMAVCYIRQHSQVTFSPLFVAHSVLKVFPKWDTFWFFQ